MCLISKESLLNGQRKTKRLCDRMLKCRLSCSVPICLAPIGPKYSWYLPVDIPDDSSIIKISTAIKRLLYIT